MRREALRRGQKRAARRPLRKVLSARKRSGSSINADFGMRWWDLKLECGHDVERPVRFPKQAPNKAHRRGFAAQWHPRPLSEALPPPKRCRCEYCPKVEEAP